MVHPNDNGEVGPGVSTPIQKIVGAVVRGFVYWTITESKSDNTWLLGTRIEPILVDGDFCLKTLTDDTVKDNLGSQLEY